MMDQEILIGGTLFDRVVQILEQARSNVVRSVHTNMVTAYWLIGRDIVIEIQGGKERAVYGKQFIETLSQQLSDHYGKGFSTTNLWYFRQFFQVYADRRAIPHPPGGELVQQLKKLPDGWPIPCRFFSAAFMVSLPCSDESHEACRTGIL